jgi:hypothetical protein
MPRGLYAGQASDTGLDCSTKPVKQSEVGEAFEYQSNQISRLESLLERLYQRLGPILRNEPPPPSDPSGKTERKFVPLAENLNGHTGRIRIVNDALEQITDHIEL